MSMVLVSAWFQLGCVPHRLSPPLNPTRRFTLVEVGISLELPESTMVFVEDCPVRADLGPGCPLTGFPDGVVEFGDAPRTLVVEPSRKPLTLSFPDPAAWTLPETANRQMRLASGNGSVQCAVYKARDEEVGYTERLSGVVTVDELEIPFECSNPLGWAGPAPRSIQVEDLVTPSGD